jgi:outer membrane cobalamin receptor
MRKVAALLCVNAILLSGGQAAMRADTAESSTKAAAVGETKKVEITGSYVPFTIKRTGRITNGPLNLIVIDRAEIEHSGVATLAQLLAREPGIKVRGH